MKILMSVLLCGLLFNVAAHAKKKKENSAHPMAGTLQLTYYSESPLKDGKGICEGSNPAAFCTGARTDSMAFDPKKKTIAPNQVMVALKFPGKQLCGCTLTMKSGPWAGIPMIVGDKNGNDTIDISTKIEGKESKAACNKELNQISGKRTMVSYELTNCPGVRGGTGKEI
ncbi:MAG: hypothetical protein ACXWQO_19820, partial [Bdellovibrionota bacterium]